MSKLFHRTLVLVLALCTVGFFSSIALADTVTPAAAVTLPGSYAGIALLVLTAMTWGLRKFSGWAPLHTVAGAAIVGAISGLVPALIEAITTHGLSPAVVETAALGALLSYFSGDNPSNTSTQQAQVVAKMRVASVVDSLVKDSGDVGIGVSTTIVMKPSTPPEPPKAAMLLPFIFIGFALTLVGCPAHTGNGTPTSADGGTVSSVYETAYLACIEGTGITAAESAALQAWGILDSGASEAAIISSLEGLGIQSAEQLAQIAGTCALQAWNTSHPVVPNVKPTPAQAALRVYYARHPALARH